MSNYKGIVVSQKVLKWVGAVVAIGTLVFGTGAWMSAMSHGVQTANETLESMDQKIEKNNARYELILQSLSQLKTRASVIETRLELIEGKQK